MINPGDVATALAAAKIGEALKEDPHTLLLEEMLVSLREIAGALSPQVHHDIYIPLNIPAYPATYMVPEYERPHFCMFVGGVAGTGTWAFRFDIPGVGMYTRTVTPGWWQVDFPAHTEISTTDASTPKVAIVFCDDARGTAI